MTLITTVISRYGIIHASDSNLTSRSGTVTVGPKVFRLGFADGALALAGRYSVGDEPMDVWLPACIASYAASETPSLSGFAKYLADQLESSTTPDAERLFHIAGYVDGSIGPHPEFYFVRNIQGMNEATGDYDGVSSKYQVTEDFWTRDYLKMEPGSFAAGVYYRYFNGFTPGRVAFYGATRMLHQFYEQVWRHPDWEFRRPASLDELAAFVRLEMEAVNTLFTSSDYPSPYIGGDVQVELVPIPTA